MSEDERRGGSPGVGRQGPPHDFDAMYAGTPPWDIGRPQPGFIELADAGVIRGRVLDVGCGTGEHALLAAGLGLEAMGVDLAPNAIAQAQRKAADRGLACRFLVWDALELPNLGESFDTVLDCGLFHVLDDVDRAQFTESVRTALAADGRYHMLCFSDRQPGDWGPRRITRDEIRASFREGWRVDSIEDAVIETTLDEGAALAWRSSISRT
jgi:SAM-dependent methyltransferase